jgi:ADP-L-glycero-D-manno-heptose 6-epimerase
MELLHSQCSSIDLCFFCSYLRIGELGYDDNHEVIEKLQPLNPYGISKNEFDKWALKEAYTSHSAPPAWTGLKFFNVYGPNEYHKERMASVIWHAFNQIKKAAW